MSNVEAVDLAFFAQVSPYPNAAKLSDSISFALRWRLTKLLFSCALPKTERRNALRFDCSLRAAAV